MYPFSPIALQQLHDAGWTDDRRIDISDYEQKVRELGIELFPCVREFLERFGNLEFVRTRRVPATHGLRAHLPPGLWREEREVVLSTMLFWNQDEIDIDINEDAGSANGISLQYIGEQFWAGGSDYALILMSSDGRVYESLDWTGLQLVGITGDDAVEACLTARPWIPVDRADAARSEVSDWRQYVERTRVIPPDEVIDLLIPDAQDAIRQAAGR
jgi:hypothetical protein